MIPCKNNIKLLFQLLILNLLFSFQSYAQETWSQKNDFGGVARYGAVAFSVGNKGYMGTGYRSPGRYGKDFWEYDPALDTWAQKADFGGTSRVFASGFSIDSIGYVGCGDDNNITGTFHGCKDFYKYNPVSNQWTKRADFGGVPRRGAVGLSVGTKGYIGTGRIDTRTLPDFPFKFKDFWEYDPVTDTWTQKTDVGGNLRAFAVGFNIGNKGYVGTGHDYTGFLKDFWEYDPTMGIWTQVKDFGGAIRYGAAGFGIGSFGYVGFGDVGSSHYSFDFWEFDPTFIDVNPAIPRGRWTQKANCGETERTLAPCFVIGDKGYIGTGVTLVGSADVSLKDFWSFSQSSTLSSESGNSRELTSSDKDFFRIYQSDGNICIKNELVLNADIFISNMMGQVILRGKTNRNNLTQLDATSLKNGIYLISLLYDFKVESKKILVNK